MGLVLVVPAALCSNASVTVTLEASVPDISRISVTPSHLTSTTSTFLLGSDPIFDLTFEAAMLQFATNDPSPQEVVASLSRAPPHGIVGVQASRLTTLSADHAFGAAQVPPFAQSLRTVGAQATLIRNISSSAGSAHLTFFIRTHLNAPPGPTSAMITLTMVSSP
ncbi:MAG: hypothetical protein ACOYKZ_05605 [Chlamydiia bacterium]